MHDFEHFSHFIIILYQTPVEASERNWRENGPRMASEALTRIVERALDTPDMFAEAWKLYNIAWAPQAVQETA